MTSRGRGVKSNRILPIYSFFFKVRRKVCMKYKYLSIFFLFSFLIPKNPATSARSLYQGFCRLFRQMTRFINACPSSQDFQIFHRLFSLLLGSCHPISHWVTKSGLNSRSRWRKTVKEGRTKSEISTQYVELLVIPVFRAVFPFLGHSLPWFSSVLKVFTWKQYLPTLVFSSLLRDLLMQDGKWIRTGF